LYVLGKQSTDILPTKPQQFFQPKTLQNQPCSKHAAVYALVDSIYRGGIDKKSHVSHNKLFGREVFISLEWLRFVEVFVLGESHNMVKKNFETEMWVNGEKLPLNHFVQETVANVLLGFSKTLKGLDTVPENMEVKIRKLSKPVEVDAHTYP
jgi:hypothetical protein